MPKGVYERAPRGPRKYPPEIIAAVQRMYVEDGMTVLEVQRALPSGFKAQRIIERHIPQRRKAARRNQSGADNHMWKGDHVSYDGVHERLKATRGKASSHACFDCSKPAHDWSYTGGSESERISPSNGCAFSTDQSFYVPRCHSCHQVHDRARRANGQFTKRGE